MLVLYIPLITWPLPSSNSIGSPLSKLESKTVPSVSFPCQDNQKLTSVKEIQEKPKRRHLAKINYELLKYTSSFGCKLHRESNQKVSNCNNWQSNSVQVMIEPSNHFCFGNYIDLISSTFSPIKFKKICIHILIMILAGHDGGSRMIQVQIKE